MATDSTWLSMWAAERGCTEDAQRRVALTTFVVTMALHAFGSRSVKRSTTHQGPRTNPFLLSAVVGEPVENSAAPSWAPPEGLLRVVLFGARRQRSAARWNWRTDSGTNTSSSSTTQMSV